MTAFRIRPICLAALATLLLAGCGGPMSATPAPAPGPSVKALPETETTIAKLEDKLAAAPSDTQTIARLAAAYVQKGRETGEVANYVQAREMLAKAHKDHPESRDVTLALAWVSTVFHDFDTALSLAEGLVKADPKDADAHGVVSDSHLELGHYDQAIEAAQRMIDLRPNLASYSRGAQLRWVTGNARGAVFLMTQAIQAGGSTEAVAWAKVQLADMHLKTGAYPAAEMLCESVLETMPDYRHALAGLGRVRVAQGRLDEAEALLARAAKVGPSVTMLHELGDVRAMLGRADAEDAYAMAEKVQDDQLAVGIGGNEPAVARLWLARGIKAKEALTLMEAEVEHHKSVPTYAALAWAQAANGLTAEAAKSADLALGTGSKEPWVLRRCAEVYQAAGQTEKAERTLAEARAVCPSESLWRLL
jgi:tetratricopeptide (TPR) repeat protein